MPDSCSVPGDFWRLDIGHAFRLDRRGMTILHSRCVMPRAVSSRSEGAANGESAAGFPVERAGDQRINDRCASHKGNRPPYGAAAWGITGGKAKGSEIHRIARYPVPDQCRMGGSGKDACARQHFPRAKGPQCRTPCAMIVTKRTRDATRGGDFRHANGNRK